ncbi:MAG TPA: 6-phosphogluconolactonase [Candidatus Angelobacter sp.]|nr:6-phosphogluconolactonase [Candidatus Angelobacter sp.]
MAQSGTSKLPEWLKVTPDVAALNRAAADEFVRCAKDAIGARGRFTVALSGGNTPRAVYALLASEYTTVLPWEKILVFFGDERHVPPEDAASNYRMANESLLSRIPIPPQNIHRIRAELDAEQAAAQYEETLKTVFKPGTGELPRFDLVMLGMGTDGHTASLFPDTQALQESGRLVVANKVKKLGTERITLTLPALNAAAEVMVIIAGENKAEILDRIVHSRGTIEFPIQLVRPQNGRLLWIVDRQAAKLI